MVLYDELTQYEIDTTLHEKVNIGLGGITTVRLHNGNVIELVNTNINYNTRVLSGRSYYDTKIGFEVRHSEQLCYGLEEIEEVIFEGFIITQYNKKTILNLIHEDGIRFTKIPRRD